MQNSILSFLNTTSPVVIVANDTIDGKPLITPFRDAQGNPKTDGNGNPIGSIRLEQHQRTLNGGFINARKRVAFLGAAISVLETIIAEKKLKNGSEVGGGKIVINESLEPFYKGQKPKINPQTTIQIEIDVNGTLYPVFAQMRFTENMNELDTLIRTVDDAINWLSAHKVNAAVQKEAEKAVGEAAGLPAENAKVGG